MAACRFGAGGAWSAADTTSTSLPEKATLQSAAPDPDRDADREYVPAAAVPVNETDAAELESCSGVTTTNSGENRALVVSAVRLLVRHAKNVTVTGTEGSVSIVSAIRVCCHCPRTTRFVLNTRVISKRGTVGAGVAKMVGALEVPGKTIKLVFAGKTLAPSEVVE